MWAFLHSDAEDSEVIVDLPSPLPRDIRVAKQRLVGGFAEQEDLSQPYFEERIFRRVAPQFYEEIRAKAAKA